MASFLRRHRGPLNRTFALHPSLGSFTITSPFRGPFAAKLNSLAAEGDLADFLIDLRQLIDVRAASGLGPEVFR